MKRIVCLLLCLVMALTTLAASAAEYYSSEPEKLLRQFIRGSGIKGTLVITAEGKTQWVKDLTQMNGVELQLRALDSKQGLQYRLYAEEDDQMTCMTEIVGDTKTAYLTSDFLMGKVYTFPAADGLLSALLDLGQKNTNWLTLAENILLVQQDTFETKWTPELTSALDAIDAWLSPYLSTETFEKDGQTYVATQYEIPVAAFKSQLKAVLPFILKNTSLMELLTAQASDEQAALYLQPTYQVWYEQQIDALPLEGNISLERTTDLKGTQVGILLDLPVYDKKSGLKEISIWYQGDDMELDVFFNDRTVQFTASTDASKTTNGALRVMREEGESFSVGYMMTYTKATTTDEKSRNHEEYDWQISYESDLSHLDPLDPARESYAEIEPGKLHINGHFYSKNGDTNAVTATLEVEWATEDDHVTGVLTLKSASPWQFPEMPDGDTQDISLLTDEARAELLNDWYQNGLAALSVYADLGEATMTDLPEVVVLGGES